MSGAKTSTYQVWGLTGGIASGKSTVARIFEQEGFSVLDADALSRELRSPSGAAFAAIQKRFGTADRARLREIVFTDAQARTDLEAILHPLIVSESTRRMGEIAAREANKNSAAPVRIIYEATLLVETGRYKQMHGLIVVDSPRETRRERLITRDALNPELADRILSSQIADEERRKAATLLIQNTGNLEDLRVAVQAAIRKMN